MDMMDGKEITAQKRAIENAIEATEQKHIEFFKSQPPMFEWDEHLKLSRCFTAVQVDSSVSGNAMRRDFKYDFEKSCNLPQEIINDTVSAIKDALESITPKH